MQILKPKSSPSSSALGWITLFSILLGLFLIPTLIILQLNQTLLNDKFYLKIIQKQEVKDEFSAIIINTISDQIVGGFSVDLENQSQPGVPQSLIKGMVVAVIPDGWMETQINLLISSLMDFVNLRIDSFSIIVDLQPIKTNLTSLVGRQALLDMIKKLPACTGEQLFQILLAIQSGEGKFVLCSPPVEDPAFLVPFLEPLLLNIGESIPNSIVYPSDEQTVFIENIISSRGFQIYSLIREVMRVFPYISLVWVILILIFSIHSIKLMVTALGVPTFIAGLIITIPGILVKLDLGIGLPHLLTSSLFSKLPEVAYLANFLFQESMTGFVRTSIFWGIGTCLVGLVLLFIRSLVKKP